MMLSSCGDKAVNNVRSDLPAESRVEEIYSAYVEGDFKKYVQNVHDYKNKPEKYQRQIINMLKQHASDRTAKSVRIDSFSVNKIVPIEPGKSVNVFILVFYNNHQKEEIVIPMLYDNNIWWVK